MRTKPLAVALAIVVAAIVFLILSSRDEDDGDARGARDAAAVALCRGEIVATYLDFYWDDMRARQPEIWAEALATCSGECPDAPKCAPVRSVAAWYAEPEPIPIPQEETTP